MTFEYKGQANLVFNQVISQNLAISGPISTTLNSTLNSTQSFTVPNGKVWKLESVCYFNDNWQINGSCGLIASGFSTIQTIVKINGNRVCAANEFTYGNNIGTGIFLNSNNITNQIIWLKAGDVLTFSIRNAMNCSGYTQNGTTNIFFSGIEFNVVP